MRVLTGITTTGTPHLGNYVGAIRPAIAASRMDGVESFLFMADYHALIKCDDPARIGRSRLEIAATWLACGLDPERVVFYRQSDIPEIPELTWLLTCVTAKGLMNRAHAYKAATDANAASDEDTDAGITMGLYSYPILMAADILMFNANRVPVGRDQVQHIEMARDIAARFNHLFGAGRELFVLPEAVVEASVATLPGLDGRKMSKSYDNTIPLFEGGAGRMREAIMKIVTDSRAPGEPKEPEGTALLAIFQAFAGAGEAASFAAALRGGLAWGEAKQQLFERVERDVAPMRARYDALMAAPERIEATLQAGAARARSIAAPLLRTLREAVGLRPFVAVAGPSDGVDAATAGTAAKRTASASRAAGAAPAPAFKQYRERDGRFYFKLLDGDGGLLLHSHGFAAPKAAGELIGRLKRGDVTLVERDGELLLDGAPIAMLADARHLDEVHAALVALAVAEG